MTDNRRWLDPGSEADDAFRELLASADHDDPSAPELESLTARLAPQLGGPPSVEPPPNPSAGSSGAAAAAKIGAVLVLLAAAAWVALRPSGRAARPPDRAQDQPSSEPAAPPPAPVPTPRPMEAPSASAAAPKASAGAKSKREDELLLIQRAYAALRNGQAARALSLTVEHARSYPRGVLGQEREVIAIEALERLGRAAEARRRGEAFLRVFPRSSHARRVRAILGLRDAGTKPPVSKPSVPTAAFPVEEKSSPAHNPPAVSP